MFVIYQPVDEKIKTWHLNFSAKENPNIEKALFVWPIVLQYDVKVKYRLISKKLSGITFIQRIVRLTSQKPRVWRGILDKNVIGSYHKVHYIEFACVLSYRTRYAVMLYSVMLYCNRNTVLSYSVTLYRNQNSNVSYPVAIYRNLYAVVSYSVT